MQEYQAKIAAFERLVGRQTLEIELLKGALKHALRPVMRDWLRADQPTLAHDWQAERRNAAIATWRSTPQGEGNQAFFVLGSTLIRLGLPSNEVEAILRQEAVYARSPNERRQQIKAMLRKLKPSPFRAVA